MTENKIRSFKWIYSQALKRFSSPADLEANLPTPLSKRALIARTDADYLSIICRRVFRAGLKHKMVDAKWPTFEKACFGFSPRVLASLSDEGLEEILQTDGIIRHWGKLKSIRTNAVMVHDIAQTHGSFAHWLVDWPSNDIMGLCFELQRQGAHLGGHSAQRFLRMAGIDTFLLTNDTLAVLIGLGVVDRPPTSKAALLEVQSVFNDWAIESGMPLCKISRTVSFLAG